MIAVVGTVAMAALAFPRGSGRSVAVAPARHAGDDRPAACASGLEPVAGGGCYAASAKPSPRPLVVYLHGLHSEANLGEELDRQARVARIATERGFDVLALRGRLGGCERVPALVCWPSNERSADRGPETVAAWEPALAEAARRGGRGARHLLGFSNGGYFAALVATRALAPFESVVVAHGGPVEPTRARGAKPPMLLLTADEDAALPEMLRLDAGLGRERWPHAIVAREGGHALTDGDIANALTFFSRASREGAAQIATRLAGHAPRAVVEPRDAGLARATSDAGTAPEPSPREAPSASPSAAPLPAEDDVASGAAGR